MKCSHNVLWTSVAVGLIASALITRSEPASASNNPLAGAMGNLRWGMRDHDVKSALKGEVSNKSKIAVLEKSYVEFNGSPTRWDNTPIAEEYTHGNDESMMTFDDDEGVKNYFFFIGGELWKWIKLYPPSSIGARDFGGFTRVMERRFGKGHEKKGELNAGSGKEYRFIEYLDRNTRIRAVDKTRQEGKFALVFESLGTVRSLASLRANSRPGSAARAMTADADDGRDAPRDSVSSPLATSKGRSIFGTKSSEDASKSDSQKSRAQNNARKAPAPTDTRGKQDKQGRSLDKLVGDDDNDPLSGLPQ